MLKQGIINAKLGRDTTTATSLHEFPLRTLKDPFGTDYLLSKSHFH